MRQDLIKLIEAQGDVTNAIVLTHNIDFVFVQLIVIPALRRCGRPTLTVFADAQCAAEAFSYQSPVLSGLGTRYRTVPVAMEPGFRFHPKALLLSGPEKATLLIGSGNLTFGGWRENAEVWIRFDSDQDTTAPFSAFRNYLLDILARVPLSDSIRDEVDEAFDGHSRHWAMDMDQPSGLLGRLGSGPELLEQMGVAFGSDPVESLIVCSPYFDSGGEALANLLDRFRPALAEILVQKKYPGLPRAVGESLPAHVTALPVRFTRKGANGLERESFIHSKFYGISGPTKTVVFAGSANCSRAALTIPGRSGNAELLAVQTLSPDEFREHYLAEIPKLEGELNLPEPKEEGERAPEPEAIRVLAARYENGLLRIAYKCASEVEITRCLVDGAEVPFFAETDALGSAEVSGSLSRVVLEGKKGGALVRSSQCWIDVESELRSTARGRSLAGMVRESVRAARWGIGAWKEVLDVFCKHLQYLPPRGWGWGRRKGDPRTKKLAEFTAQDVFSSAYGLPSLGSAVRAGLVDDRVHSLQQMLLRWFGIHSQDESDMGGKGESANIEDGDSEDDGDRPEPFPLPRKSFPKPKPVSKVDRKWARKSLEQMTKAMTADEFLARRPPELLAADLKIAAVLLRTALKETWISETDFFETTRLVWSSLFFSSTESPSQGWLERRQKEFGDPDEFALRMTSPELCAALAAWSMAATSSEASVEHVSHALAQVLAVARLPWLWRGADREHITRELARILVNTEEDLSVSKVQRLEQEWLRLIRRGEAFRALEEALVGHSPSEMRHRIHRDHISSGELLWQGSSGYCVTLEDCGGHQRDNVRVIRLQGAAKESDFKPGYLIPIKSLLGGVLQKSDRFGTEQRETIRVFIEELSRPFSTKRS
jgi:hypothetical protein